MVRRNSTLPSRLRQEFSTYIVITSLESSRVFIELQPYSCATSHYPTRPFTSASTLLLQWVMERTYHAVDSEEHVLNEPLLDLRGSYEDEEITRAVGIHLASIAEKKRLWLKNALLNTLFIAIWSVDNLQ